MKKKNKILLITILLSIITIVLILIFITNCIDTIRTVSIIVVDEQSNEPLSDVIIHYSVGIIGLDYTTWGTYEKQKIQIVYKTDKNGMVIIPRRIILKLPEEQINYEEVAINIDISQDIRELYKDIRFGLTGETGAEEDLFNPMINYRGYIIVSGSSVDYDVTKKGEVQEKIFDILWNKDSLTKEKEDIVVKLKHRTSQNSEPVKSK